MTAQVPQTLVVHHNGKTVPVDRSVPFTIGRDDGVGLRIDSSLVSRRHATIRWADAWILQDQGSSNGTWIAGERITEVVLTPTTEVRLGDAGTGPILTFRIDAPASDRETTVVVQRPVPPGVSPEVRTDPAPVGVPYRTLTVGRAPECDVRVPDATASRRHAKLLTGAKGLTVEDLDSTNGTFVNGQRIKRALVQDGDVVSIGSYDFIVRDGSLTLPDNPAEKTGLALYGAGFTVKPNKQLLADVSFVARPGTLTAVIGPSGAGKSTLSNLVAGINTPTSGVVSFGGHNVHAEYAALRHRIGLVPQDDVLHRQLTVRQALSYAAELRLPHDTTPEERSKVIDSVIAELGLTKHAETRVDNLSGGQRKRASVALELLTSPSLLLLDEPTSGLDPALDRQVMVMLRQLADHGRVVLVVTHSLTYLNMCDHVLLLAPGGKTAYYGPPAGVVEVCGTTDWADIFTVVADDPEGVAAGYAARHPQPLEPPDQVVIPATPSVPPNLGRQIYTLVRRQFRLIFADRGYLGFLVAMPFVLGVLALVVPGSAGFGVAGPDQPSEPGSILVLLVLGACFMGTALTARDLVGERSIYLRERAVGLRPGAYQIAKTLVFCLFAVLQSIVLVAITLTMKPGPKEAVVLPSAGVELWVAIALTACCCVVLGLLLSSVAKSAEQVMPLLVVSIMGQLVFSGGLITVTGRFFLDQLSWLFPARWGFAAGAATVDLTALSPVIEDDRLWKHSSPTWVLDIEILAALAAVFAAITFWRLTRHDAGR